MEGSDLIVNVVGLVFVFFTGWMVLISCQMGAPLGCENVPGIILLYAITIPIILVFKYFGPLVEWLGERRTGPAKKEEPEMGQFIKFLVWLSCGAGLILAIPVGQCLLGYPMTYWHFGTSCDIAEYIHYQYFYPAIAALVFLSWLFSPSKPPKPYVHPATPIVTKEGQRALREFASYMDRVERSDERMNALFQRMSVADQELWRARYEERTNAAKRLTETVEAQRKAIEAEVELGMGLLKREATRKVRDE